MDVAPNLHSLLPLVGTWRGEGAGEYPTIDAFAYTEEVVFTDVAKPFLHYLQRTWGPSGSPMHTETGYVRSPGDGRIELILAQPTGHTELCEGAFTVADDTLEVDLHAALLNSMSAKEVTATHRRYELTGDSLVTTFAMAAVGQPLTHHLRSELWRA